MNTQDEIAELLMMACLLLECEARSHDENQTWPKEQRKGIAKTLRGFTAKARGVLSEHP